MVLLLKHVKVNDLSHHRRKSNGKKETEKEEKKEKGRCELLTSALDFFQVAANDPRFTSTIFAESAGGSRDEVENVISVFLNRVRTQGLERALKGSSAFNLKSPQFKKAFSGDLNKSEKKAFDDMTKLVADLALNPENISRFNFFENVNAFGNPDFATSDFEDIGRQRFFFKEPNPAQNAAEIQRALAQAGFNPGPIDGFLGNQTKNAIKAFQSANGLSPDGIVGPKTKAVLFNAR